MMDHINSYCRGSLGDKSPYDMFEFLYGREILRLLECHKISPQDVTLNKSVFRKEVSHREMEDCVPMTKTERNCLRKWVRQGHDPETNPWNYLDSDGYQMNYLQAFRLEYGYSSGPWDYWKGPDTQLFWDNELKTFISRDDYC